MNMRWKWWMSSVCFLSLLFPVLLFAQLHKIHGYVFDDSTHQALPFATIRIEHSDIVTSSNKEGQFILDLSSDKDTIIVSFVGYCSRSLSLSGREDTLLRIGLHPALIQLPDYFVIANEEDPAMAIMREVIKRRDKNYDGLNNYEVTGYKRNILYSSNRIAMIDEQMVRQLYEHGSLSKDFILATHKTENIKNKSIPFSTNVCASLFFTRNNFSIRMGKNDTRVIFPLADNAFQYYDFKLLNTKNSGKEISHTILVLPRSSVTPLIKGKIIIDDATFALIGADIETSEGWILPLVKNFSMKIQQAYSNYHGYWIPQYSEVELEGAVSALGGLISFDHMKISETFSVNSCKVNGSIPDSIKKAKQSKFGGYTTDTLKAVSKLQRYRKTKQVPNPELQLFEPSKKPPELTSQVMDSLRPLPLTQNEKTAFMELDSTKTLDKVITPNGALSGLASSSSDSTRSVFQTAWSAMWHAGQLHNNRVEGIAPGVWFDVDNMDMNYFYHAELSYATALKLVEWNIGGGYNFGDDHLDRIEMSLWNNIQPWQSSPYISKSINSLLLSITGVDYFNYLRSTGFAIGIHKYFTDDLFAKITYSTEMERSVSDHSILSLAQPNRQINPEINEGNNNTLRLQFGFDPSSQSSFLNQLLSQTRTRFVVTTEFSKPVLGSDFNFQKYSFIGNIRLNSIYPTAMNAPYFFISVAGGVISGKYGIQHLMTPSTALSLYAPAGVLKGLRQYDLAGDKYIMMQLEHNWQNLPFSLLHSKKLEESGIQIITGGSIAQVWNSTPYYVQQNNWKPYWEVYLGIAGLLDLFRFDVVYNSNNISLLRMNISSMIFN
jgi:hypothetical protein